MRRVYHARSWSSHRTIDGNRRISWWVCENLLRSVLLKFLGTVAPFQHLCSELQKSFCYYTNARRVCWKLSVITGSAPWRQIVAKLRKSWLVVFAALSPFTSDDFLWFCVLVSLSILSVYLHFFERDPDLKLMNILLPKLHFSMLYLYKNAWFRTSFKFSGMHCRPPVFFASVFLSPWGRTTWVISSTLRMTGLGDGTYEIWLQCLFTYDKVKNWLFWNFAEFTKIWLHLRTPVWKRHEINRRSPLLCEVEQAFPLRLETVRTQNDRMCCRYFLAQAAIFSPRPPLILPQLGALMVEGDLEPSRLGAQLLQSLSLFWLLVEQLLAPKRKFVTLELEKVNFCFFIVSY